MEVKQELLLLGIGFVLTTVVGGLLTYYFQKRAWGHQHDVAAREQASQQALEAFDQISRLLDKRLYRMRELYWAFNRRRQDTSGRFEKARSSYREVLLEWNESLNRTQAIVEVHFGPSLREELSAIQDHYAVLHRAVDALLRAPKDQLDDIPNLSDRFHKLAIRVYDFNVSMLKRLRSIQDGKVDSAAAKQHQINSAAIGRESAQSQDLPVLALGMNGTAVRTLQCRLRQAGATVAIDGMWGWDTEQAVRGFQRSHGLAVDGVVGATTWVALPLTEAMPQLRE